MTWNKRVPFNPRTGDLLDYVDSYTERSIGVEWKNNFEFDAELEYVGYSRGRSSAQMLFQAHTGTKYFGVNMFLTDFDDLIGTIGFNGEGGAVGSWEIYIPEAGQELRLRYRQRATAKGKD